MFDVLISEKRSFSAEKLSKLGFENVFFIDQQEAVLISADNKQALGNAVSRAYSKKQIIFVLGSNDEVNRAALENKRVSALLNPEQTRKKDFMHSRNSGLNHVLCKLASQNNIAIGISFEDITNLKGIERAERLGRIMQNIMLCRKYNTKILLASFGKNLSSCYDLRSLGFSLGMTPSQAKSSLELATKIFKKIHSKIIEA